MKRWHQDYARTYREWKKHHDWHVEFNMNGPEDPFKVNCPCDTQVGRFRKKDAWDCGNTQCYICHGDKFPVREKTRQEMISELSFREQLREM